MQKFFIPIFSLIALPILCASSRQATIDISDQFEKPSDPQKDLFEQFRVPEGQDAEAYSKKLLEDFMVRELRALVAKEAFLNESEMGNERRWALERYATILEYIDKALAEMAEQRKQPLPKKSS